MADKLKVVIPVDFSETSRLALAWAFDYAMRAPCELHVLHVVEDHLGGLLKPDQQPVDEELRQVVTQTEAELHRMLPDVVSGGRSHPIRYHCWYGKPAPEMPTHQSLSTTPSVARFSPC